ncbi:hypothetical protein BJF84_10590 [Rhodococcus sp. CUA-806]|nr:hypothetical protein BJF84_10590 [Rhodococcus sp. CUA-806]
MASGFGHIAEGGAIHTRAFLQQTMTRFVSKPRHEGYDVAEPDHNFSGCFPKAADGQYRQICVAADCDQRTPFGKPRKPSSVLASLGYFRFDCVERSIGVQRVQVAQPNYET